MFSLPPVPVPQADASSESRQFLFSRFSELIQHAVSEVASQNTKLGGEGLLDQVLLLQTLLRGCGLRACLSIRRGKRVSDSEAVTVSLFRPCPLQMVLACGHLCHAGRLEGHPKQASSGVCTGTRDVACLAQQFLLSKGENPHDFVLDVSQCCSRKPWSKKIRSLTTSNVLWSFRRGRCLLAEESFRILGFPEVRSLDQLSQNGIRSLTGEAMSCPNIACILASVASILDVWEGHC